MHRVFCNEIPEAGATVELEARETEHLFKVFRARPGDEAGLLDGRGTTARAVVEPGRVLRVVERTVAGIPAERLHLCCAVPKKAKLDQLLKQAAELGVWSIRPVRCRRSVAEGGSRERWDLLLREACKQSGNPFLPRILPEEPLPDALERLQKEKIRLYYGSTVPGARGRAAEGAGDRAVLIGPEGGFTPEEVRMMADRGAEPLNLGPYILRLETAAVCALAALRMLGLAAVSAVLLAFAVGCSGDAGRNPLMVKGRNLQASGDAAGARDCFRRAAALYPDDPAPYLALARVCDEDLDAPLEAAFAYQLALRLLPAGSAERAHAEAMLGTLRKRAVSQLAGESVPAEQYRRLEEENAALRDKLDRMEKTMVRQQLRVNELYAKVRELEKKRTGGKR